MEPARTLRPEDAEKFIAVKLIILRKERKKKSKPKTKKE